MLALARSGVAAEGFWLRAERQTAGRGRQGREWVSPVGNFYGSTVVQLRPGDPAAATLSFVAAVAVWDAVALLVHHGGGRRPAPGAARPSLPDGALRLKWPNDLLLVGAKLAGILLERADDTVVVGIGVNLAHHPDLPDRPATSLAAHGVIVGPETFVGILADSFARWLQRWRSEGFTPIRQCWLKVAHPRGDALAAHLPDGARVEGLFEDLDPDGALILRLASGERRAIHAGDVFLV
ncbi:biotin--[acetyl-CoA-carboxylase] ligase [Sphingomonas sp.]|uniref:biotin--[acetyl-CoA-carboxylase] ligase n=1 Tax=Sphingomonas sp. TaxID=28214 RepID=UPI002D7FF53F|nr:biotin--[acetyl-CoA-carboxylase] ligase [Sphingomonas sp.]HEU0044916.1 biotin--[acetyl-CoA-carboxylase] ligase [Sphingomonas sp.]